MACNCGAKKNAAASFTVTAADGKKTTFRTKIEAVAAAKRIGGTVRPN